MTKSLRIVVLFLFILSGFTSLVYQAVWIRLLSLAVGSTSQSMSLVLGIFFLGLAAGSYFFGKWAHRIERPLKVYGLLEGLIGILALLVFAVLASFPRFVDLIYWTGEITFLGHVLKYGIVFLILIFPTFFMGASLPLLVRLFQSRQFHFTDDPKKEVSLLYGLNTLGAVLGSFSAGFILYPWIGIGGANALAVFGNLLIMVLAWKVDQKAGSSWTRAEATAETAVQTPAMDLRNESASPRLRLVTLAALTFVTGFVSISMEVIWSKYLGIFLGTNIFGLSLILSIFLSGIALGSLLLSWVLKTQSNLIRLMVGLLVSVFVAMMFSTLFLQALPLAANLIGYYVGGVVSYVTIKSALAFLVLFLPALFFGALLPLIIEILSEKEKDQAQNTGIIYAVNTVGGIVGSVLTGLLFIPNLGSEWTTQFNLLLLLIALCLVCVVFLQGRARWVGVSVLVVFGLSGAWKVQVNFQNLIRSAYQQTLPPDLSLSELYDVFTTSHEEFVMIHEGETAVISLSHDQSDGPSFRDYLRLKTNGLNESIYNTKNRDSLPKYEALLGLLPYSLVRDPQKAFIVGYGGGYSPLFFSSTDLKEVVVAEIEEGIIKAATFAHDGKFPFAGNSKIKVQLEDARFLLAAGIGGPYDIIASQPSHSWLSGVANLFTEEFFEIVKGRLTEKGVFSQWLNLYNMDPEVLRSILKTFFTVFPHGAVFTNIHDEELILIGSQAPVRFNLQKLAQMFKSPSIASKVADIPLREAEDLVAHLVVTRDEALVFSADAPINSDLNAHAEILQSRLFYRDRSEGVKDFLNGQFRASFAEVLPSEWGAPALEGILNTLYESQSYYRYNYTLGKYQDLFGKESQQLDRLAFYYFQMERYASALEILEKGNLNPIRQATIHTHVGNFEKARLVLARLPQTGSRLCLELQIAISEQNLSSSQSLLKRVDAIRPRETCGGKLLLFKAQYGLMIGALSASQTQVTEYLELNPSSLEGSEVVLALALIKKDKTTSDAYLPYIQRLREEERSRVSGLAEWMKSQGFEADGELLSQRLDRADEP